ncbi:copper amine oxidase N-terminal domain-containing protein [Calidifontibacillus oryziterrae]|uniref:copper amine oxidase N-terminal domain-containing protein n=1 Tax=Calidifontibacillus oryziterrae TaxID=1191699 RepID=UPI0002ED84E0|nr:copper amine oxidase N-terminal domain-containing protein [Calidifontibacillus oryziterrae]
MKKITTIALTAMMSGVIFSNSPALAQNDVAENVRVISINENNPSLIKSENPVENPAINIEATNFIKYAGVVSEIEDHNGNPRLLFKNQEGSVEMIMTVTDEVLLFNSGTAEPLEKDQLQIGDKIEAFYDKNKPRIMIYPPMITPEIIIVHDEKISGQVKVAKFDDNLLSLDNELKLKLNENTILINQKGEPIEEKDLYGKELIVFYDISTKSIPAQTSPKKIITFELPDEQVGIPNDQLESPDEQVGIPNDQDVSHIDQLIKKDHYMKNGTKMVPLRKIAEHFGYDVNWQEKTTSVLINKQNRSFLVTNGNLQYGYNQSQLKLAVSPEIKNDSMYVPEQFIEMLLK